MTKTRDKLLRFNSFDINEVTLKNYREVLPASLVPQIELFVPPQGSFDNACLKRYLNVLKTFEENNENSNLTLANQLRLAFSDMKPETICGRFPKADLKLKRRLRCVAEYLIRSGEFSKMLDENGKVKRRIGVMGKLVVIYKPENKILETLKKQGLL